MGGGIGAGGGGFNGRKLPEHGHKLTEPTHTHTQNLLPTQSPKHPEKQRPRYKESTEIELAPETGALPQSDYEGDGEFYVGRIVSKEFDGTQYRGIVTNCDVDKETGGEMWEITYEDMDMEDLHHAELMKVLVPERESKRGGRGNNIETMEGEKNNGNISKLSSTPRTYISSNKDTFQQICRERFDLRNVEEMKMYHKHLAPELKDKIAVNFSKKRRRSTEHARSNRVGEGHEFPHPEDLPGFIQERDALWKSNFREVTTKEMGESMQAAHVIAEKSGRRSRRGEKDVFSVDLKREEAFLVEKSSGKILAPERVQDAIDRDDLELWLTAWNEELEGLSMNGEHISHNHTLAEVRAMGILEPPLPTRMISAAKYRGLEFDRRKGRMICQGFRAIEGIHHDGKSFAASPSQHTQKILMSLVAGLDYDCLSWDIKTAYLFGERKKPVCLSYPQGFRRDKNGEALFMVARRGHYGEINAGRMWAETRTKKILEMYDDKTWSVHICKTDPCLNVITYWPDGKPTNFQWKSFGNEPLDAEGTKLPSALFKTTEEVKRMGGITSYMSVYTDDIDVVGPDKEVLEKIRLVMNKAWNCKIVPSNFMLGVQRDVYMEEGVKKVRMSQAAFFENAFDEFELYTKSYKTSCKYPKIPLPAGVVINKSMAAKDDEEKKLVLEMGYQKLAGCILWGARGCCPESLWAASQVCSVMSCPSRKAFDLAIGVLAFQYSVRERGIVFSSDGNEEPILLADASFKIDPHTGKTQYGTLALLYGGPIIAVSKKIPYVALSTPHAELCAMNYAARTAAWLRNFFEELGQPFQKKTLLLGDNTVAVLNATEDVVSEKNKYIQLAFHYIKERKEFLDIHHVRTELMVSDMLTKSVSIQVYDALVGWLTGTAKPYSFTPPRVFK